MPTFKYNSSAGTATIDAEDRTTAIRMLLGRGVAPSTIEEVRGKGGGAVTNGTTAPLTFENGTARRMNAAKAAPVRARRGSVSLQDTASFIRELATAVSAGLPLVTALRTLARAGRSPAQTAMLNHLIEKVESGTSLADAAKSWGKPFDELLIN